MAKWYTYHGNHLKTIIGNIKMEYEVYEEIQTQKKTPKQPSADKQEWEQPVMEEKHIKDIRKIYIKNYGNLSLEIQGTNEIGVSAYSEKRKEELFIPWESIIMISKIHGEGDGNN